MKIKSLSFLVTFVFAGVLFLTSCESEENPMEPNNEDASYTMNLHIEPTTALRTADTQDSWTDPVEIAFNDSSAGTGKIASLMKIQHTGGDSLPSDSVMYIGSRHTRGMDITAAYGNGRDMWQHQNGMMEHHRHQEGAHHYQIQILDETMTEGPKGGMTIPYSQVTLFAMTDSDTTEILLEHVHGGHGFRYESNAELPLGTYDLKVIAQPPDFYRTSETSSRWTEEVSTTFSAYHFDAELTSPDSIGENFAVNADDDSMLVGLTAGPVETYYENRGADEISTEGKTINFSVNLEDPSLTAGAHYMYDSHVSISIEDETTGETETHTLNPTYGPHGFYFGENLQFELPGEVMSREEHMMGGHGPGGGHMGGGMNGPGGGMMR